jgi:Putative adhesin
MSETWQVDGSRVIEVGGPEQPVRRVVVRLVGGRVDVVAHDDPEGRLEVRSLSGRPVEVSWDGAVLEVAHPQTGWDSLLSTLVDKIKAGSGAGLSAGSGGRDDVAEVSVAVPRGADVQIGTVTAEGLAVALTGKVEVRTVTGRVTLDGLSGPVVARTVSGEIEARGQSGEMRMDSVSGSFVVQSDGAPSLVAKTVSGSLTVDSIGAPLTVAFQSVSGGVVIRRPEGPDFDVDVSTASGRVVIAGQRVSAEFGLVKHQHREPGASVTVQAKTVSGDITLLAPATPLARS